MSAETAMNAVAIYIFIIVSVKPPRSGGGGKETVLLFALPSRLL